MNKIGRVMGRKPLGRKPKNITLPPDVIAAAEKHVADKGRTLSDLIERLLRSHLNLPEDAPPRRKPPR